MSFTPRSLRDLEGRLIRLEIRVEIRRRVRPEIWELRKDGEWADTDFYDWEGPCDYLIDVDTTQPTALMQSAPKWLTKYKFERHEHQDAGEFERLLATLEQARRNASPRVAA